MLNNKIKIFLITFSLIIFFSIFSRDIKAVNQPANKNEVRGAQKKICLQGKGAGELGKTVSIVPSSNMTIDLTGSGFGNANAVYVGLCLPTDQKTVCTTGDPELDKEIFGADFTVDLKNVKADAGTWSGYKYGERETGNLSIKVLKNKLKPTGGNISTTVNIDGAQGHFVYPFYGFYQSPTIMLETGGAAGDQQGTFTFDDKNAECTSILWDPYGRIFDSQSLEPIPNIEIKVLSSISPVEKLTQIYGNPQTTVADGAFNFLVEPGTYYLRLINPPTKYLFNSSPNLNSNYYKAYSKRDGTSSIYKPDEPIVEVAKKPEHRDIPLDPGKNPPGHFPMANIVSYGFDQMTFDDSTKYGGKISHPLSMVALVGKNTKKEVTRIMADKFGFWNVSVENKSVPQNEPLLIKLIKVDLTTMKPDEKNGKITNDVIFYPIARKIDGYIYNNGKIVANTPVVVTLENNNKPFYQTTTNSNGYLSIPSNKLPNFPYNLITKLAGTNLSKSLSTDVFAEENKVYLEKNNINLMVQDKTENNTANKQKNNNTNAQTGNINIGTGNNSGLSKTSSDLSNSPVQVNQIKSAAGTQKKNTLIMIILLFAVVFIILAITIILYVKKQRNTNFQGSSTESTDN